MGPLDGIKVIEIAGIGPGPFCAMVLADLGAEVIRVDRAGQVADEFPADPPRDILNRGRKSIGVDLKNPEGVETILRLCESADALIEGFRPGVAERLGIGPDACMARNPRLVYGRMTGWGQTGSYASMAGHDINYIALSGVLGTIGREGQGPVPPINLVGDFGGGGMLLALGVCAALVETGRSGQGQVIDAAMTDGSALLAAMIHGFIASGMWGERGTNMLDTGAPFYDAYECADGEYISIGSIEPQFYAELMELTGLGETGELAPQHDRANWADNKAKIAACIKAKTRDEWVQIMEGSDVCFAPVLSPQEAYVHPHNVERETFVDVAGIMQPAPAPRFSRTPGKITSPPPHAGQHTDEVLSAWGFATDELGSLRDSGAIR